ncbi:uncharacterized protein FTOL_13524 [Fusarium torulosum]|uniref:Uncharacterized protein n=1 Tax=Fusarium torulosum TaxID=33205 RepID=A0AAE8MPJ5_9HYPO|nr:uncharacterized protein FTOL_13524 [Fusarium torulosum]
MGVLRSWVGLSYRVPPILVL